jgi:hypothetical protein
MAFLVVLSPSVWAWAQTFNLVTTYFLDEPFAFDDGTVLVIVSGSSADAVITDGQRLMTTIAKGSKFTVRYPGPNAGVLLNDAGKPSCMPIGEDNQVMFEGPKTITIIPTKSFSCSSSVGVSGAVSVSVSGPQAGVSYGPSQHVSVTWQTSTQIGVSHVRISLSLDGGETYTVLTGSELNDGLYQFVTPSVQQSVQAVVKVDALAFEGTVLATAKSAMFTVTEMVKSNDVTGLAPITFQPLREVSEVLTIADDKGLLLTAEAPVCSANTLIKGSTRSVYYCGSDGKRYVFPNEGVYFSWYGDFSGVKTISDVDLARISLGGNITYRPGVVMVKLQSIPVVYVVSKGGVLHAIPNEITAAALYGAQWSGKVRDISDAQFVDYRVGAPVLSIQD